MSILWCGGEDIDFPYGATPTTVAGTYCRPGYARLSLTPPFASSARSAPFADGALTSFWASARMFRAATAASRLFLGWGDSATGAGFFIGSSSGVDGRFALWKTNGVGYAEVTAESGVSIPLNEIFKLDIQCVDFGPAATINVFLNGGLLFTFTGDVAPAGIASVDGVILGNKDGISYTYLSEMIVADEDTRLFSLATLAPNAAGDANAWAGAYTDISETIINDASVLYTDALNVDAQVGLSDAPAGTFTVRAVQLSARVAKSVGATAGSVCLGVKSGGTIDPGVAQPCTTAWAPAQRMMAQNPVTGNIWQLSEVNELQLNLRSAV